MKMKLLSRKNEASLRWNKLDGALIVRRNKLEISKRNLKNRIVRRRSSEQMLKRKCELLQENRLVNLVATSAQETGGRQIRCKLDKKIQSVEKSVGFSHRAVRRGIGRTSPCVDRHKTGLKN